jgi:hypothetical protein
MSRWSGFVWEDLPTTFLDIHGQYYRYETTADRLSIFAIRVRGPIAEPQFTVPAPTERPKAEDIKSMLIVVDNTTDNNTVEDIQNKLKAKTERPYHEIEEVTAPTVAVKERPAEQSIFTEKKMLLGTAVILAIVIAGAMLVIRCRKKRKPERVPLKSAVKRKRKRKTRKK